MGHRAEKQMYGTRKGRLKAKADGKPLPRWQPPKIGVEISRGRRSWNPRHVKHE